MLKDRVGGWAESLGGKDMEFSGLKEKTEGEREGEKHRYTWDWKSQCIISTDDFLVHYGKVIFMWLQGWNWELSVEMIQEIQDFQIIWDWAQLYPLLDEVAGKKKVAFSPPPPP